MGLRELQTRLPDYSTPALFAGDYGNYFEGKGTILDNLLSQRFV